MTWLGLALLCAFALASADAATKAWLGDYSARELALVRFSVTGLLLLPLVGGLPSPMALPAEFWGLLLLMWPLEIAAMLLYMAAIRDHPLSLTVPFLAFTPVFVIGIAYWLLDERVSVQGAAGIAMVVVGAWLLNAGQVRIDDWRSWARPLTAIFREPGSRMMLGVAVIFALTSTMGKRALDYVPAEQFGAFYFLSLGLLVPLLLAMPGLRRIVPGEPRTLRQMAGRLRRRPAAVLTVAGLNALMIVTHFLALERVEVAYMIAVKRTSLLFGILYGALVFREPDMRTRLPAGGLMVVGVAVILTG